MSAESCPAKFRRICEPSAVVVQHNLEHIPHVRSVDCSDNMMVANFPNRYFGMMRGPAEPEDWPPESSHWDPVILRGGAGGSGTACGRLRDA